MKNFPKKRKSAYFFAPGDVRVIENKFPKIEKNAVVIKIKSCMICGSDLRIFKEGSKRIKPPRIVGHEIAGVVIYSKYKNIKVGDKVALGADIEKKKDLAFGHELDGGFSEFLYLKNEIVKKAPIAKFNGKISYEEAALSEPLACCINGFEKIKFEPNKIVTIFGCGSIGLMIALLSKKFKSKKIIMVDNNQKKLNLAKKIVNCSTIYFSKKNFLKSFLKMNNNLGSDYIFTANSSIETQKMALKIVSKGAFINFFGGVNKKKSKLKIDSNHIHYNEIHITGSHGSNHNQHKKALKMIEKKQINLKPIITHNFSLDEINKAYKLAMKGEALKISIKPN
tara:strand:+ start:155 stop:1168 length:1014 start_codon:yes stop_codon:yes gene_type:complete